MGLFIYQDQYFLFGNHPMILYTSFSMVYSSLLQGMNNLRSQILTCMMEKRLILQKLLLSLTAIQFLTRTPVNEIA